MTSSAFSERHVVLRLEFSIADAVQQRGLVPVLVAALRAYWQQPRLPQDVPAYLRADIGLDAAVEPCHWTEVGQPPPRGHPLRRPPM